MVKTRKQQLQIQLKDGHRIKGWVDLSEHSRIVDIINTKAEIEPFMKINEAVVFPPRGNTPQAQVPAG